VHSPRKAAILSSILPGAGQIYNKAWVKVPIVYGGLGTAGYFIYRNNKWFKSYKNEYLYRIENGVRQNPDYDIYSDDNLLTLQSTYRRWRDLSVVITAAIYVVQIVDATVDAHFFTYDVSDDISLQWCPTLHLQPGMKHPLPALYLRLNTTSKNWVQPRF
jgi:hypothetical protein